MAAEGEAIVTPAARPHDRQVKLARLAWVGLTIAMLLPTIASWPAYFQAQRVACETCLVTPVIAQALREAGISLAQWAAWSLFGPVATTLGWAGIGLLIFARRPNDRRALLMSALLIMVAPGFGGLPQSMREVHPEWLPVFMLARVFSNFGFFPLIFMFPNGRLAPRWAGFILVYLLCVFTPNALLLHSPLNFANWPVSWRVVFAFGPMLLSLIGIPAYRYWRVFSRMERQQTKWVLAGFVVTALVIVLTLTSIGGCIEPNALIGEKLVFCDVSQTVGFTLGPVMIPVFIGIAILRSRLFDIDVIIRRTLVYSVLTGLLAFAYFGSILVLESVFRAITGQGRNSLVIVLSTLAIAALSVPLRSRVQRVIDRRFFRSKYDAARILAGFSVAARDEVDLDMLSAQLVDVVDETMQPASVGLWLRPNSRGVGNLPPARVLEQR